MERRIRTYVGEKLTQIGRSIGGQNAQVTAAPQEAEEAQRAALRELEEQAIQEGLQSKISNMADRLLSHKKLGFKDIFPHLSNDQYKSIVQFTEESLMQFIIDKENHAKVEQKRRTLSEEELIGLRRLRPLRVTMPEDQYAIRNMTTEMIRGMIYQRPKNNTSFPEDQGDLILENFKYGGPLRLAKEAYIGGRQVLERHSHIFDTQPSQ